MKSIKHISKYYLIALALLFLVRIFFIIVNYDFIPIENTVSWFEIFLFGFRFDLSIVALFLSPLLVLGGVNYYLQSRLLSKVITIGYHVVLIFFILSSLSDVFYFSFNLRRATIENVGMLGDTKEGAISILLHQPWFVISSIVFIGLYFFVNAKVFLVKSVRINPLWVVSFLLLNFIFIRGLNTSMLSPLSVPLYTQARFTPYVTNAPQSLLFSYYSSRHANQFEKLEERFYFTNTASKALHPYYHQLAGDGLQKRNVVIFILESFSRSYLEEGNSLKTHTPFLDSIMKNSLVCTNAFANGVISLNGVQNILSGIPTIEAASFLTSPYYANQIKAMPALLAANGYQTYFFHGFKKDLFGFERLTKKFGVQKYYSDEDYTAKPSEHTSWGIHDKPFFMFAAKELTQKKQPFMAALFNISSHHPYQVPLDFQDQTLAHQTDVQNAITYVDYSLQNFFAYAQKQDWHANTLYVFVADHWNKEDATTVEKSGMNRHKIPLFFYAPYDSTLKGTYEYVMDQNSIYPSVLDLLGYKGSVCSFGKSLKDTSDRAIAFMYQHPHILEMVTDQLAVQYDKTSDKTVLIENYKNTDKLDSVEVQRVTNRLKAYIQNYSHAQRKNELLTEGDEL